MIFVTQINTGTMVKRFLKNKLLALEANLLENYFLPFPELVMLMSFRDVLNFKFL